MNSWRKARISAITVFAQRYVVIILLTPLPPLQPFNAREVHKTSKALLNKFITVAASCDAAGKRNNFLTARQLHVELTVTQAKLIKSLEKTSMLREMLSKQFPPKEPPLRKILSSTIRGYRGMLDSLQTDSDFKSFESFLRKCLKTYDASLAHEVVLNKLYKISLQSHDFALAMDARNELELYIRNCEERMEEAWRNNILQVLGKFEVANEEHFVELETKLLSKIKDKRRREDAKNLSRQRVRDMLLKKCDETCRTLEQRWCKLAWSCTRRSMVRQIYRLLQVWCDDAKGYGLPEDVEERLAKEKTKVASDGSNDGNGGSNKGNSRQKRRGSALSVAGSLLGVTSSAPIDPNGAAAGKTGSDILNESDPFLSFKRQLKEKDDGLVTVDDIDKRVKEEIQTVRRGIKDLRDKKDVDPMEVSHERSGGKELEKNTLIVALTLSFNFQ